MPNPWLLLVALVAAGGLAWAAYDKGRADEAGAQALLRQKDIELAYKAGAANLDAESRRAQTAQRQRDALARQLREIDRENPVLPRPDCRWTDAEFGLLESRRTAHAAADSGLGASPLHGAVPGDAGDRSGPAHDSERPAGLGLRLPGAAAGVPRLGEQQK